MTFRIRIRSQRAVCINALLLLLFSMSKAKDIEIMCCNGWSDDLEKVYVSAHTSDSVNVQPVCTAAQYCEKEDDEKCSEMVFGAQFGGGQYKADKPPGTEPDPTPDCYHWKPEAEKMACTCNKNHCNCPDNLRGQEFKEKPKGLKCCDNTISATDIKTVTCIDELPQPLGCVVHGQTGGALEYKCGFGNRLRDECHTFPDRAGGIGKEHEKCYCNTDECNCPRIQAPPPPIPTPPPKAKTNTTSGSFQLTTCVTQAPLNFLTGLISIILLLLH